MSTTTNCRMKHYSVQVSWSNEDHAYVATSIEFPGLSGIGRDEADALAALVEARDVAIQAIIADGEALPVAATLNEFSGQFRLRIPKSQHAELSLRAHSEGVSLNSWVAALIAIGLGNAQAIARLQER